MSSICAYHGSIATGRGIEMLIDVIAANESLGLLLIGPVNDDYRELLIRYAANQNCSSKVLLKDPVPLSELASIIGAADIEMITIPATSKSYYYMLPNKLFESIQAEVPILASDYPEIRRIVEGYGVGLLVDPLDHEAIRNSIHALRRGSDLCNEVKDNLKAAKETLCWERERAALAAAYTEKAGFDG